MRSTFDNYIITQVEVVFCKVFFMFTLLSGLWQHLWRRDEYYVLLVGLDEAGKTVLLFGMASHV